MSIEDELREDGENHWKEMASYLKSQSIMPARLERAEEGRKARFHRHLEAHLKEFWPGWMEWSSEKIEDPLLKIYDRKAQDGVNYEKDLPHGGKLVTLVHVQK